MKKYKRNKNLVIKFFRRLTQSQNFTKMKFLYHCVGSLIDLDFKDTDDSKEFYYSYTSKGQYVRKKFHKISKVDLKNDVDENVVEQEHVRSYISIFTTLNTLGKE